jgi:hypothetical protein
MVVMASHSPVRRQNDMNAAQLPRQVREAGRSAGSTTTLERNGIGCAARDRFVIAMEKAIEPVSGARRRRVHYGLRRRDRSN